MDTGDDTAPPESGQRQAGSACARRDGGGKHPRRWRDGPAAARWARDGKTGARPRWDTHAALGR